MNLKNLIKCLNMVKDQNIWKDNDHFDSITLCFNDNGDTITEIHLNSKVGIQFINIARWLE